MAYGRIVLQTPLLVSGQKIPGSILTNPNSGTILASSGALKEGRWLIGAILTASVAIIVDIQHRNSADSANVETPIRIRLAAAGTEYMIEPSNFQVLPNEIIKLNLVQAIVGEVQGVIFVAKVK